MTRVIFSQVLKSADKRVSKSAPAKAEGRKTFLQRQRGGAAKIYSETVRQ
jgi:hypothetical protein